MSSIVPPPKNLTFTLCLSVLRSFSLISDIIESPTMATVPSRYFTSVTLLLICIELIHSFDLFLCDRSIWSACSSYVLRFKKFVCFPFKFPAIVLVDFRCKLPFHKCYYCSFYFCCYCYHCSCFYSYCY